MKDRIAARETGVTVGRLGTSYSFVHTRNTEVADGVGSHKPPDFIDFVAASDQLAGVGSVNSVEARSGGRGGRDPEVNLGCAGLPEHSNNLSAGGAPNERIVDYGDLLACEQAWDRVELELDPKISDWLGRLDEAASDVVVADKPELKGDALGSGIADGGGHP